MASEILLQKSGLYSSVGIEGNRGYTLYIDEDDIAEKLRELLGFDDSDDVQDFVKLRITIELDSEE